MMKKSLLEPASAALPATAPILAMGFRPFFLLAAVSATLAVPLWVFFFEGTLTLRSHLSPVAWHAHEMVFGYTGAVLAGFVLTAARTWTKLPTAHGATLGALVALWLLGRALSLAGASVPLWLVVGVNAALLPLVGAVVARPIVAARSWRNLPFPLILTALGGLSLTMQLADRGVWPRPWFDRSLLAALDGVVLAIMVVGGRILPGFTANALGAEVVSRRDPGGLDRAALLAMGAVSLADVIGARGPAAGATMLAAALLPGARMWGWGSLASRREPLLWVLHAGWAAVAVGLALRGAGEAGAPVPRSAALHALTVGAIGALTLGMMARVALGHTARPLKLPPGMGAAFALVLLAALLRVLPPIVAPGLYRHGMHAAAGLWAIAFALFVVRYGRVLVGPRVDGRPG